MSNATTATDKITVELNPPPAAQVILLTGITGQMGSHLADYYVQQGCEVHGFVRHRSSTRFLRVEGTLEKVKLHQVDIRDPHGVSNAVNQIRPQVIHHLAAMTFVPYSWTNPLDTFEINVNGTINMLEAARKVDATIHFSGSSEEYGIVQKEDCPLLETHPLKPHSPYGVAKVTGEQLCVQYNETYGLHTVPTRAFNHEGPRRGKEFIGPVIVRQAIQIQRGQIEHFSLGNLKAVRDMSDYRDMVGAYVLAVSKCDWGEPYNICSMKGISVAEMVVMAEGVINMAAHVVEDKARLRPTDIPVLIGDSTKFRQKTGWMPQFTFYQTMQAIFDAFTTWRADEIAD